MAQTVKLKRSAVAGKAPAVGDLALGELALNTYDGKLYAKRDNGTASVVEIGGAAYDLASAALPKAGGTLSGAIELADIPSAISAKVGSTSYLKINGDNGAIGTAGNIELGSSAFVGGVGNANLIFTPGGQIGLGGANYGTSGQVLTSAGSGAAASWQSLTFGTTAGSFCQGNDSRLSDTRTPTDGSVTDAKVAATAAIAGTKIQAASTTNVGVVQLVDSTSSTSTTTAATPNSVKDAFDVANIAGTVATAALPKSGGTMTGTITFAAGQTISGYLTTSSAASTYAPLASPTFTGTVTIPAGASISGYLTTASAASTYQPISGMSSYLTTASAASTYQTQAGMSSYLSTSSFATQAEATAGTSSTTVMTPQRTLQAIQANSTGVSIGLALALG
jgi:hypothetical protein